MTIIFFSGNLHKAREIEAIFAPFKVRLYTDFMKPFSVVESGKTFSDNAKIKLNALKNAIESQGFDAIFKGEVEQKDCILMAEDSGICVEALGNLPHIFSARFANLPPLYEISLESPTDFTLKDSTDSENVARLISELRARNLSESNATFISCVACCKFDSKDSSWRGDSIKSPKQSKAFKIDCHDFAMQNLAMTKYDSSLRGSVATEAIQKNNVDCHDSTRCVESRNDEIESQKDNHAILTTHGFLCGKVICNIRGDNGFGYDPIFIPNGFESTLAEMPREAKNALSHRKNALDLMRLILCPLSAKNLS